MTRLSPATLAQASAGTVTPSYDRAGLVPGIAHFGVGGFHRAHQAMVLDNLLTSGKARDWAIMGIGVRDDDSGMRQALLEQEGLYTLVEKNPDGSRDARVIGSILGMLTLADDGVERVLDLLTAPTTKIVSFTVTEGGYNISQSTGEFLIDAPEIVADLAEMAEPRTVFGLVVEALRRRREAGTAPFTVMSCDNLQDNGRIAKRAILTFATRKDAELAQWIESEVRFPNSMVDRITPATTDEDRRETHELTGLEDAWPVVCEPFFQWVLEDSFSNGRPPYEETEVQLVDDVEPYELMKLRLLNASHQAVAQFGRLLGYKLMDEAESDPLLEDLHRRFMRDEAAPTLQPVPGIDLAEYEETLVQRFANPGVRDTVQRVCWGGSDRIAQFMVPVVQDRLKDGKSALRGIATIAAFARGAAGVDDLGNSIDIDDERKEQMIAAAAPSNDPLLFVRDPELFGDLAAREEFTKPYLWVLGVLEAGGARALLTQLKEVAE
ncbi:MAG: mannitol dehydrogenase family protein [Leucobacter sp.]